MKKIKIVVVVLLGLVNTFVSKAMLLRGLRQSNRPALRNPTVNPTAVGRTRTLYKEEPITFTNDKSSVIDKSKSQSLWARTISGIRSFFARSTTPTSVPMASPATTFSRSSTPFGKIGQIGSARQTRYYSSLVPTTGSKDPSLTALAEVPTGPSIPISFEPSFKSKIPYTTEYEIEALFETMNQKLRAAKKSEQLALQDIQKFKALVTKSGYNPINREIQGQSSFLARLFEQILINESDNNGNVSYDGRAMLQECYSMGARFQVGEIESILKKLGWDKFLEAVIKAIDTVKKDRPLKEIHNVASQILSLYDFFKVIEFDLTKTYWANAVIDMDAMRDIVETCNTLLRVSNHEVFTGTISNGIKQYANANLLNQTLFYFSPECEITFSIHLPRLVKQERSAFRDYPIGYSRPVYENTQISEMLKNLRQNDKFVSTFAAQAEKAGFFKAESGNILRLPQNYFDEAYNQLMYNEKYVVNEPLYHAFMQKYAPDKLKPKLESGEVTQELFDYISEKIAELNAARQDAQKGTKK